MPVTHRKTRIPKLCHTDSRGIGFYVTYRHPESGTPVKHRFGNIPKVQADAVYKQWLADFLKTGPSAPPVKRGRPAAAATATALAAMPTVTPGSLIHVTSSFIQHEQARICKPGETKRQGSIHKTVCQQRVKLAKDFLKYLNDAHGKGAVGRLKLADLLMQDVEGFNKALVAANYAQSTVNKGMQVVKAIIDRAGRPEHGGQLLGWNWDSRDAFYGKASQARRLPTRPQLEAILERCSTREKAIVWMAIGLGFGQKDLSSVLTCQIDAKSYDLRRSKTGMERFGDTPPGVWRAISAYLAETPRRPEQLLFVTAKGLPLKHSGNISALVQWWTKLRASLPTHLGKDLDGFYVLRHLGATEFGSRPGCSISDMRRWLGHATSSKVADLYMKPVAPEYRGVVDWVRSRLLDPYDL